MHSEEEKFYFGCVVSHQICYNCLRVLYEYKLIIIFHFVILRLFVSQAVGLTDLWISLCLIGFRLCRCLHYGEWQRVCPYYASTTLRHSFVIFFVCLLNPGPRSCPGQEVARRTIFLTIANLVQKYTVRFPEGPVVDVSNVKGSFTMYAPKFEVLLEPRSRPPPQRKINE